MPASLVEPRKIQVLGGSTYTVSIPKKWVDRLGIHPGDFVSLQLTRDGHLLLRSKSAPQEAAKTAVINSLGLTVDELHNRLIGLYLTGFRTIEVRSEGDMGPEALNVIRDLPRVVSGLELVLESKRRAVLEDIIDPTKFSLRMALDRMYALFRASMVCVVDGLLGKGKTKLTESLTSLQDVERLSWIVLKQQRMVIEEPVLAVEMKMEVADAVLYAMCAQQLKSMASAVRDVIDLVSDGSMAVVGKSGVLECVEIGNSVISVCDKGLFAFTRCDLAAGADCLSGMRSLEERIAEVRQLTCCPKGEEACASGLAVSNILDLMHRVADMATGIAELAYQRTAPCR